MVHLRQRCYELQKRRNTEHIFISIVKCIIEKSKLYVISNHVKIIIKSNQKLNKILCPVNRLWVVNTYL